MATPSAEKSYHFADFIRFMAMCAIIFQHSFIVEKSVLLTDYSSVMVFFFLKVAAKIGTISFFLISGFLLSSALDHYSSKDYLNKRVKDILKPYLLFVLLYLILDSIGAFFGEQTINEIGELPSFIATRILGILFFTSYWFILNYFISVMVLLSLRKYLYAPWFGTVLFCCTLIYAANVHLEMFTPHHTIAFVGFAFFLWLGANVKKHEISFKKFIDDTPVWKFIMAVIVTLSMNFYETYYLIEKGAIVVDSSLKLTNIMYAVSVFILLYKVGNTINFRVLNPREETYPLYLIHPIFLKIIHYAILPLLPAVSKIIMISDPAGFHWLMIIVYQLGWFVFIYTLSVVAVKIILNSPLRLIFGKAGKVTVVSVKSAEIIDQHTNSVNPR